MRSADIGIVGAGIVGIAHAYFALLKGYKVVLFDREQYSVGASVRNFGLIWPIGQQSDADVNRALRSAQHWKELSRKARFWINQNGSLQLAYHDDEWEVLQEFDSINQSSAFQYEVWPGKRALEKSPVVNERGLKGALFSHTELTVKPREAVRNLLSYLEEHMGLIVCRGTVVKSVDMPSVETSRGDWQVQHLYVCTGADLETLYPDVLEAENLVKCKLQMLKSAALTTSIGPTLSAGLTLLHYKSFANCPSLVKVKERYQQSGLKFLLNGIHVLVAQHSDGELIIGDSHHYGKTLEPFDLQEVNDLILEYLHTFTNISALQIVERWHGIYARAEGKPFVVASPEKNVTIVNSLGGAGMTLSFGLAEEIMKKM